MKVSIIILNWNTLSWLKKCVWSIKHSTDIDYELIIVDNGSKETGTEQFIEVVADKKIMNPVNFGFSKGNNQGAEIAEGEFLCFLNSDTIVTQGWLDEMIKTYEDNSKCGAVGPLGNVKYMDNGNGQIYAYQQFLGQYNEDSKVNALVGYCLLIKRDLFNKIKWDESFEYGMFEDNLLCDNLNAMGYELWISANSSVLHPHPSRSFKNNNIDISKVSAKNHKRYNKIRGLHG